MFTEENTTEEMILSSLSTPEAGWKYLGRDELKNAFGRKTSDVLVDSMVKSALIRLNPEIAKMPSRADEVIFRLHSLIGNVSPENLVSQNEKFKKLIFEENSFPFGENGKSIPVIFFGTEINGMLDKNEYVITNQWSFPKDEGGKRFDIVLLINGFPLIIGEVKTPVRSAITWLDGAMDLADYEKSVPQMFVTNVFTFATEGKRYRYGAIKAPFKKWGPWRTEDNEEEGLLSNVLLSVKDMISPCKVMDIFQFFTLYATDEKFQKYKIVCRYQQYDGANKIVLRVLNGYPKKGLIWHFQGSGKTLLMVFAAQKLRMLPQLRNPTIAIIDDRLDLESDMTESFSVTDIPNTVTASTGEQLRSFFEHDTRKILISTIYKFGEVEGVLNSSSNIVVMVDEAHRTQEGDLGLKMRTALPNAFFFGLTGTPINRIDHNTFATFGATEDENGYMSKYGFVDSLRDGATLPLDFVPGPLELKIDKDKLNEEFDALTDGLSDEQKSQLSSRVGMDAIMCEPNRIHRVAEHIAYHFTNFVEPNGYKAQVVCYNRDCCVLYKAELDKLLPEIESDIIMTTDGDKADQYKQYHRNRDEEKKIKDRFKDARGPLKILIVCDKLLTGFDAPILQAQYLDKPMKDHTLLQAICRTNRPYDQGKTHGLIIDYIGIFDDAARALGFDEKTMKKIVTNIQEVKDQFPGLMAKALSYFDGLDRTVDGWEGLSAAQECLPNNERRDLFAADFQVVNRAWNALSPDPFLNQYKTDYLWLSKIYESIRPADGSGALIWADLGPKTMALIHQYMTVGPVDTDVETISLDAQVIEKVLNGGGDPKKAAQKITIDLMAKIRSHSNDPKYKKLGEKLEDLKERHEAGLLNSIEFLKELLELAKETVQAEKKVIPEEEQDKGKNALTELFNSVKNKKTPVIVSRIVDDIDSVVKHVRFQGWQNTIEGKKEVKKVLRNIIWIKYKIKDQDVFEKACHYVETYY
jgi:type I restriction enzyme R subunit